MHRRSLLVSQRILVVDDDELICDLVGETLGFEGYEVEAAYSGAQALQVLAHAPADLVLLDIVMAGMDGLEVYRHLLQDARLREIPVIFFTAGDQPVEDWQDADESVFDFVAKPFHPLSLAPKIRETLARNHADAVRRRRRQEQLLGRSHSDTAQPMDGVGDVR
jgi:CheY-like chemotaxis protein